MFWRGPTLFKMLKNILVFVWIFCIVSCSLKVGLNSATFFSEVPFSILLIYWMDFHYGCPIIFLLTSILQKLLFFFFVFIICTSLSLRLFSLFYLSVFIIKHQYSRQHQLHCFVNYSTHVFIHQINFFAIPSIISWLRILLIILFNEIVSGRSYLQLCMPVFVFWDFIFIFIKGCNLWRNV